MTSVSKKQERMVLKIIMQEAWALDRTIADVIGPNRNLITDKARARSVVRARLETGLSYNQLAVVFKRDHSTLVHAFKVNYPKIKEELEDDRRRTAIYKDNNGPVRRRPSVHAIDGDKLRTASNDSPRNCFSEI